MAEFKRRSNDRGSRKFSGRSNDRRDSGRSGGRDSRGSGRFERRGPSRFGGRGSDRPEKTIVTCDSCKQKCEVPFKPTSNKPVYCNDCFKKNAPRRDSGSRSGGSGKDFAEINRKLDLIIEALEIE